MENKPENRKHWSILYLICILPELMLKFPKTLLLFCGTYKNIAHSLKLKSRDKVRTKNKHFYVNVSPKLNNSNFRHGASSNLKLSLYVRKT